MINKLNLIHNKNNKFLNKIINQNGSVMKLVDIKDIKFLLFLSTKLIVAEHPAK